MNPRIAGNQEGGNPIYTPEFVVNELGYLRFIDHRFGSPGIIWRLNNTGWSATVNADIDEIVDTNNQFKEYHQTRKNSLPNYDNFLKISNRLLSLWHGNQQSNETGS